MTREPVDPPAQDGMPPGEDGGQPPTRLTAWVRGRVQGVGFRGWVRAAALELGLVGGAANLPDGRVEVVAEGPRSSCESLLQRLGANGAPGSAEGVTHRWSEARGDLEEFVER